jgi:acetoin utilization deacetylase AcuC-like enzyme
MPKLEEFAPEFLLASAGFDAHVRDPLGGLRLTDEGYAGIGKRMKAVADQFCQGRLISLLEGGYDLKGLAGGVTAYLGAMVE